MDRRALLAGSAAGLWAASARAQQACFNRLDCFDTQLPGPSLDLQFTSGTLDPRITFTRASVASYFDVAGVLQTAGTNVARFDYDPVTHAAKGLLIEEARTNLVLRSTDITQAVWTKLGSPSVTGTPVAPDGTATGQTVSIGISTGPAFYQVVTLTSAARGEPSFWINPISTTGTLNIQNPSNIASGQWSINMASLTAGVWQRITRTTPGLTITTEFSGTAGNQAGIFVFASTGTINASWWGWQFEAGAFPTSYIPTAGATATRAADVATMPTGSWFNGTANSVVAEADAAATGGIIYSLTDAGGAANRLQTALAAMKPATTLSSGSVNALANPETGTVTAGTAFKFGSSLVAGSYMSSLNGAAPFVSTTGIVMPAGVTQLALGLYVGGNILQLNGHLRRVRYWPRALSGPELQAVTR